MGVDQPRMIKLCFHCLAQSLLVSPEDRLSLEHSNRIRGYGAPMLRSASEAGDAVADSGLTRPHVGSAFHNPETYVSFLQHLRSRHLLEWQIGGESYLGVFFCLRKMGGCESSLTLEWLIGFPKIHPKHDCQLPHHLPLLKPFQVNKYTWGEEISRTHFTEYWPPS